MLALLMGFNYLNSKDDSLVGACVDIYQMYRYCRSINIPSEDIYVLTDIEKDISPGQLRPLLADDIIDIRIASFIQMLKEKGTYLFYRPLSLIDLLRSIAKKREHLFVYFSGHG